MSDYENLQDQNSKSVALAHLAREITPIPTSGSINPDRDTTIIVSTATTVQLNSGAYPGLEVTIQVFANASIQYTSILNTIVTDIVTPYRKLVYTWTGTGWFCSSCPIAIGDIYTQMPDTPDPQSMYGGQWEEHSYGGMFFRSQGGNAHAFVPSIAGTFSSATVFVASSSLPSSVVVGDLVISDSQYATITAISGTSITIDTAITNWSNKTNLLIGQVCNIQSHNHSVNDQYVWVGPQNYLDYGPGGSLTGYVIEGISVNNGSYRLRVPSHNTNATGDAETRAHNISCKAWLRNA